MTHDIHAGPEGAVLWDECGECRYRSEHPDMAISHMDPRSLAEAWARAMEWNAGDLRDVTSAELPVLRILWAVQVQLEQRGFPLGRIPSAVGSLDAILADALTPLPDIASWAGGQS
jgi:hypothetical protein